jgi:2-polyprenyl-3-methyl-5-hydroxy-6-metoxy-1,4-benzoquinol methylase
VQLCRKAAEKGYTIWADTSIELGHLKPTRTIVTRRNRHQYQIDDTASGDVQQSFVAASIYDDLVRDAATWTGYRDLEEMTVYAQSFHDHWTTHKATGGSDADWYRLFPKERVARQVWFNTTATYKRQMTDFILGSVNHAASLSILDFGCGIGIPAYVLAEKGHDVMAMDIAGTGTFEFLQWRAKRRGLSLVYGESPGGVPHLSGHRFDIIVAMDVLEHLPEWRRALRELVAHLKPGGVLFCNNAVLDDPHHAEHYDLKPKAFQIAAAEENLIAANQIMYLKRADVPELVHA